MKKLLFILLALSSPLFAQISTQKVNNTAVIYAANSTLNVNGNVFFSNLNVRGFIFQTGAAGADGSSNLFRASTNAFTGLIKAYNTGTHEFGAVAISSGPSISATGSSASLTLAGGAISTVGVRIANWGLTVTNNLSVSNSFTVGGTTRLGTNGSAFVFHKTATASLNFGNILAAGFEDLTITVGGAAANDSVMLGNPVDQDGSLDTEAFVSAANTVTVRAHNVGSLAVDQASKTYRVTVINY